MMKFTSLPVLLAILAGAMLLTAPSSTVAATAAAPGDPPKVNLGAYVTEIMRMDMVGDDMTIVLWMPHDFFIAAGESQGLADRATIERQMAFLKDYMIFIAQSQKKDAGMPAFDSEEHMRSRASLIASDGTEVKPLTKIPPNVAAVAGAMATAMAAQSGNPGGTQNMHIVIFPAKNNGKEVVDPTKKDSLTFKLKADDGFAESACTWHTPFDAMTPAQPCPKCRQSVSAKWNFCPWCGEKSAR